MNPDDRLRRAFDDLRQQAQTQISPRAGLEQTTRPRRWVGVPALAAALSVLILIGGAAMLDLLPGNPVEPPVLSQPDAPIQTTPATDPAKSNGESAPVTAPATSDPDDIVSTPVDGGPTAPMYRVDTDAVRADTGDPFLNVRVDPDPDADLVVALPPTYSGVVPTGEVVELTSGSSWWEVELRHPVGLDDLYAEKKVGWVNARFLLPLPEGVPVTLEDVPGCRGESLEFSDGAGTSQPSTVTSVDVARIGPTCVRYVVGFGTDAGPANHIPPYSLTFSGRPIMLSLGSVAPGATGTGGLFVTRAYDGSVTLLVPGADVASITPVPDRGFLVVDVRPSNSAPPSNDLVALTSDPLIGGGIVSVTGVARPFEANLVARVETATGEPIEAVHAGSVGGTVSATEAGYWTTDWTEAWGRFVVEVSGIPVGDFVLILDPGTENGADELRVPFSMAETGEVSVPSASANLTGMDFATFASDPSQLDQIPLADRVTVGLVEGPTQVLDRQALADPASWVLDVDEYRGRVGTTEVLRAARQPVRISDGVIPHCAAPPAALPNPLAGLDQVNLEPIGVDSCLDWFSISLFLDGDEIVGVLFDLWEP